MRFSRVVMFSSLLLVLVSCGKDIDTPFERLKSKQFDQIAQTDYCQADAQAQYPADIVIAKKGSENGVVFAQGGGCVSRPILDAWAATRAREFFHWNKSDLDDVSTGSDPDASYLFHAKQSAGPPVFGVSWIMDWYHQVEAGSPAEPTEILIQYQKVQGTSHIRSWAGAIVLRRLSDTQTSVTMRDEIDADSTGPDDSAGAVHDIVVKVRTLPAGG